MISKIKIIVSDICGCEIKNDRHLAHMQIEQNRLSTVSHTFCQLEMATSFDWIEESECGLHCWIANVDRFSLISLT